MDQLKDLILNNISTVVFIAFVLFGLLSRGSAQKEAPKRPTQQPQQPRQTMVRGQKSQPERVDNRPLAERLAEAFGVDMSELRPQQNEQSARRPVRPAEGRRSTTTRNVQDDYPDLFGGPGLFENDAFQREETKWGFDETEWGSTFEKNDEQWGHSFPERKSSEPRIEWPN